MSEKNYLAFDLGAESGRLMLGCLADGRLSLQELHRFQNIPVRDGQSLHWNIQNLVIEIKEGLRKASGSGRRFQSVSTDSWGVDFVLFDAQREIIEPAFHYRDPRSKRGVQRALEAVSWEKIFQETGIQYMPINTIFQLAAEPAERLNSASLVLGIGDAINYFLSGVARSEVSLASTFQLYNPVARRWSTELIEILGLPGRLFPPIISSGTRLGPLRQELAAELGLVEMSVVASCSHDTGAAVAGVPATGISWAYLSSGTWSLMGVELEAPIITERSRELNFTNEIGFGNSVRLLKNLSGLWLIQECRRAWAEQGKNYDYAQLTALAGDSAPFVSLINPAAEEFLAPENMPDAIAQFCRRTNQVVPENEGAFTRSALESLALLYRKTLLELESLTGRKIERLHIVGGGSRNDLLNQFTADALQIPVLAGPAEATAIGNVLIQAMVSGDIPSLEAAREIVRESTTPRTFDPQNGEAWAQAFARFQQIRGD